MWSLFDPPEGLLAKLLFWFHYNFNHHCLLPTDPTLYLQVELLFVLFNMDIELVFAFAVNNIAICFVNASLYIYIAFCHLELY